MSVPASTVGAMTTAAAYAPQNQLFYGDNLEVLRRAIPTESVDLVYLDPPFNSNRNYNVIFAHHDEHDVSAQLEAFGDTWQWTADTDRLYDECINSANSLPLPVINMLIGMRTFLGENDASAYLVNMAPRLVELHRVLKSTGSLYLHCDQTMSHYLKILLDAIFGVVNFRSDITWLRTSTHNDAKRWSPNADQILYYSKSQQVTWNPVHLPHSEKYLTDKYRYVDADGRRFSLDNMTSPNPRPNLTYEWEGHQPPANGWRYSKAKMAELDEAGLIWYPADKEKRPRLKRYLDEQKGIVAGNVWTDISPINSRAAERLGYPTQKPITLLERIIAASTNPNDIVLDPFAGCGTTIDAAQRLGRRWIGIDITYIAIDLIEKRLRHTYGKEITASYVTDGIPRDLQSAEALFRRSPFDFERWAVSMLDATPNDHSKQRGDKGVDGEALFDYSQSAGVRKHGRIIISVKGGQQLNPAMVRDLQGTVESRRAELGVLITLNDPTRGMLEAANTAGYWERPDNRQSFPKIQIVTVSDLLAGNLPKLPDRTLPYVQAKRTTHSSQTALF